METQSILQMPQLSRKDHLFGIVLLVAFLLPHSNTLFLLANPVLCLLLVFCFYKSRKWKPYVIIVVVSIILSILVNLQESSQKAFLSTFTILLYFFCFPFVGKVRVNNNYLYICLGYIFLSQIVYVLNIPFLTVFFDNAYPIGEDTPWVEYMQTHITYDTVLNYRLGGLYHNPNQCATYLCFLLSFFLVNNNEKRRNRNVLIFSVFAFLSILFTGSRTGFVVASFVLYFGLLHQKRNRGSIGYLFVAIAIILVYYLINNGNELRGFDVRSGFQNSANLKWDTFVYYLGHESSVVHLLFGHLDTSLFIGGNTNVMNAFDSEYGELVFRFGFVGIVFMLLFWWMTAKRLDRSCRFFFLNFLWVISSTIVASYRAFFIFMLLLSAIYSNCIELNIRPQFNQGGDSINKS